MALNDLAIGVFDSGIGGLSVLKEAAKALPNENFIYLGDDLNAPYGEKSEDEILFLSEKCADFLAKMGVKAFLIACNTATSAAVKSIREKYSIPVISMEPAVLPAFKHLKEGYSITLATPATVLGEKYLRLLRKVNTDKIISVPCYGLVDLVEQGDFYSKKIFDLLYELLHDLQGLKIDSIVLGCTHYNFIKDVIYEYAENYFDIKDLEVFDGIDGTVKQLKRVLEENNLLKDKNDKEQTILLYSSAGEEKVLDYQKIWSFINDDLIL
ncbi:MAG: glutamate racemase [Eubacteriales bacterium]